MCSSFEVLIYWRCILSDYVFSVVNPSKIKLNFWFTDALDMGKSAFHKVDYQLTYTIKVIEDAVSFFSVIACKIPWMHNLSATQLSQFRKTRS